MSRIVIELTNRCNLSCRHCFSGRHGGRDDLPMDLLRKILAEARHHGFNELSFTGGEPTIHPCFQEVLELTCRAGYRFGFNTNGRTFTRIYPSLLPLREQLNIITFSLDGASEESHDRLRGKGSFRQVMQAVSVCVARELPFTLNMVVAAHNRHELEGMAHLATGLGSHGLRYGHLMPAPLTTAMNSDLSPWDRKLIEAEIRNLRRKYPLPIAMGPGYHTTDLFPCAPLQMQEMNVDCHGNLTKCCHLSGHGDEVGQGDVIGYLGELSFGEATRLLTQENEGFHREKTSHLSNGSFRDSDFFSCWYCSLHYRKVAWLREIHDHPWAGFIL